ncbi:MarR family transcriptional regulator [Actinomadura logoneensis]|uniref:MarR family transcriptional regulator n=2 Tax=Actinomadura logoneensis TaxID=2293572 RepID=A0A372JK80_9ACTN|nr:MarR family transcriptional regulator [Actinomadura logoneensis]
MAARVFVALLATDAGALTASELSEELRVSPAAVSGAVRYLIHLDLVSREREPGTRRDLYRVENDAWQGALTRRDAALSKWAAGLQEGVALVGPDTAAGRRLAESAEFFDFLRREIESVMDRWAEHRKKLHATAPASAPGSSSAPEPSGSSGSQEPPSRGHADE